LSHEDEKLVVELLSMLSTPDTLFNKIYPAPEGHIDDINNWNNDNWGTKWEPIDVTYETTSANDIIVSFDSAWSPPIGIYKALIEKGWVLTALYHERESEFCGRFSNEHGDEFYEYDSSDPSTFKHLPEDILDFSGLLEDQDDEDSECDDENE
jgi:hypothetical protein